MPNVKPSAYQISIQRELKWLNWRCVVFATFIGNAKWRRGIGERVPGSRKRRLEWGVPKSFGSLRHADESKNDPADATGAADRKATMNQAERQDSSFQEGFLGNYWPRYKVYKQRLLVLEIVERSLFTYLITKERDCSTVSLWTVTAWENVDLYASIAKWLASKAQGPSLESSISKLSSLTANLKSIHSNNPVSNPSLDPVRQSTAQHCRNSEGEEIFFAIAFRSLNKKEKKPVPYSAIQRFHRSAVRLSSNANSITGLCQILQGTAIEFSHGVIRSSRSILQRSSLEEFQYVAAFIVLSCYPAADRWAKSF